MEGEEGARERIRREIILNPGLHFRELQRRLSLPTGVLEYHLNRLVKDGDVEALRDGKYVRYYPSMALTREDKRLLKVLRRGTIRKILLFLADGPRTGTEISEALGITPSTTSRHLAYLQSEGVIAVEKRGRTKYYSLRERERMIAVLKKFRRSFMDKLVDNFLDGFVED